MTVESVTQAVSNLALQFGEEDADPGAMVSHSHSLQVFLLTNAEVCLTLLFVVVFLLSLCILFRVGLLVSRYFLEELMKKDPSCMYRYKFWVFSCAFNIFVYKKNEHFSM